MPPAANSAMLGSQLKVLSHSRMRNLPVQPAHASVHAPRRFDSSHMMQAAFASFGAFQLPRIQSQQIGGEEVATPQRAETLVPPVPEDVSAAASLDWPDHLQEAYKLGRVYGHGA